MNRYFLTFCGLMATVLTLTSCLSSDNDVTTYDDMAITSFTLGKLNRYVHTTNAEGRDTVYKETFTGSAYKLNIDQINHTIYNSDSLPLWTDLEHVICTVNTKNNGIVYLKRQTSDTLTYFYSGADSVDFRQPRVFRVYSTDGMGSRDYTVSLIMRKNEPNVFQWTEAKREQYPVDADSLERQSAEQLGYTYLGRTYVEAYAISNDGQMMELELGDDTWKPDRLDTDASMLPTKNVAYTAWMLDIITDYAMIVGACAESDTAMTVWRKLADYDMEGQWVYMPLAPDNIYYLPKMDFVRLAYFNKSILAFGSNGIIYVSRDQGITWKQHSGYKFPTGFNTKDFKVTVDDDDEYLWLMDNVSGQTWKGYLSK